MASPKGKVWSSSYWPNGLLHVATLPSGSATYDYDALGRPSAVTYSNAPVTPNVSYSYDADGNRTQMSDGAGTAAYVYDDAGRMSSATRGTDTFSYTYYPGGQLKKVTYPDGAVVGYQYDRDDRLCTLTLATPPTTCAQANATTTSYAYDAADHLTSQTLPAANGSTSTMAYDTAGRLMSVTNGSFVRIR